MKIFSPVPKDTSKTIGLSFALVLLYSSMIWMPAQTLAQTNASSCEEMLLETTKRRQQIKLENSQVIALPKQSNESSAPKAGAFAAATCDILTSGLTDVHCNDNGTPNNQADDYLVFYLKPTGNVLSGSGYNVSVEGGGTTITPTSASSYGTLTKFRLGNGSANGSTWAIRITDKANSNCFFVFTINCPSCSIVCPDLVRQICIGENTSFEIEAPAGLTNVVWYDSTTRTQIGTGSTIIIDNNTLGMSDGYESYYFKAKNSDNCDVLLCCPARFKAEVCCNIQATVTPSPCNNNGTRYNAADDYFTITVSSTNTGAAGPSNAFEVVLNGTTVIGTGTYGTPLVVGNATTPPFKPDGVTTYSITVRDKDKQTCITTPFVIGPIDPCFIPEEGVVCTDPDQFFWGQDVDPVTGNPSVVRLVCGSTTSYTIPGPYPAELGQPVKITSLFVVSYDGYPGRASAPAQPNEKWRMVFKNGGSVVGTTPYTGDIADGVLQDSWDGDLGMVMLPAGTDEIIIEHYSVANDPGCANGPNSVDPVGICMAFETLADWGDLPDATNGTGTGNYQTRAADNGPSHRIINGLKMGSTVDEEADGNPSALANGDDTTDSPDDEDGVTLPMFVAGQTSTVPVTVMNMTGSTAKLTMFMDFNNDGDFSDPGEMASANAPNGTNGVINISMPVPVDAVPNTNLGVRFRLSTDAAASMNGSGPAPDGEVEDYLAQVMSYDWGDLADATNGTGSGNYQTRNADNGPSHKIISGLKMGSTVDAEGDGNPSALANGDDNTTSDDEDGVTLPMFIAGQTATIAVNVMNMTGSDAKLTMFMDFNNDGDFNDAGEMTSTTVVTGTNGPVNLSLAVPANASLNTNLGVRFRLSNDFTASMNPTGQAPNGEVEDYLAQIMGYDLGDLADSGAGTGIGNYETQYASNGPSHKIISGLKMGTIVDAEGDGNQSALANGDDNTTSDDEDGVTLPMFIAGTTVNVPVTVMNTTGSTAKLTMFMDFNNDGDFSDPGEMTSANAPNGTNGTINLSIAVPTDAVLNTNVGVRFRLSTDANASMSALGAAPDGEVEDYLAQVMGYDRGDLADASVGTSAGNYQTQNADNGPSHKIISGLKMGLSVDPEANGNQSTNADGDDLNGIGDDEDGVTLPVFYTGNSVNVPVSVMNMTGSDAKLTMFFDFNNDGDFNDAGEMAAVNVLNGTNGSVNVPVNIPVTAVTGTPLGVRARLSTDPAASMSPTGAAPDGEVEDYLVTIIGPDITHTKTLTSLTQTGPNIWKVTYAIEVKNNTAGSGIYGLDDISGFEDDITILSGSYTSDAPGNPANPGPVALAGTGPWPLAINQLIIGLQTHHYNLSFSVKIDLSAASGGNNIYKECGDQTPGQPKTGEGLFNRTELDIWDDGSINERDTACGDLPYIIHDKIFLDKTQVNQNTWNVRYQIDVTNQGGATGQYDLQDQPAFDNDITINNAAYTSDAPGNPGIGLPITPPWVLANDQNILAGGTHKYIITVNVTLDLENGTTGDDDYTACGANGSGEPKDGEGLFNRSLLDVNNDGNWDQRDSVCADLPYIIHEKTISSVTMTGVNTYNVTYQIQVENIGGASDQYNLWDKPAFDDDITINSTNYTTNASGNPGNPGPAALIGTGPWTLASNQTIGAGGVQTYTIVTNVTLNLTAGTGGDNQYTACETGTPGVPISGEGLFNESRLDIDLDGNPDRRDSVCADLPYIVHEKTISGITKTGANTYKVDYQIRVENIGGASGSYDLKDQPGYDDDITINSASYTSNATGNAGNPGPAALVGVGPWTLATNQNIVAGGVQLYNISVNVKIDLSPASGGNNIYTSCGNGTNNPPQSGQGLFNQSLLDVNRDGNTDYRDSVCADLPYIIHDKKFLDKTQVNQNTWNVRYQIDVTNQGGAAGQYDLRDEPVFDNDITINNAAYTSDAPGNPGIGLPITPPWTLANDQNINASTTHKYIITVNVTLDLEDGATGDDDYTACGANGSGEPKDGEGLFNRSLLDVNNDGNWDQRDSVCADLPYIIHEKTISSVTMTGVNNYNVTYQIQVKNIGGDSDQYNLWDKPAFDDDITINSTNYTTNASGNPGNPGPAALIGTGPWTLASNQTIAAGGVQTYTIVTNVTLNLTAGTGGDNQYTACETGTPGVPISGEGLFNESRLDIDLDGNPDRRDSVCADLPYIVHEKLITGVTMTGANTYKVDYQIRVENIGGASGSYDLKDQPGYDDDITINSASYTSNATGNAGNPGPAALVGVGPWTLATNQNIVAGGVQLYNISVNVKIDLSPASGGNNIYTSCGNGTNNPPQSGQGLFNQSLLDVNRDGNTDYRDSVCADLPYIVHEKRIVSVTDLGSGNYTVKYGIKVDNIGGASGQYDLYDDPGFDDDFDVLNAQYASTAPGHPANPGPIALAGIGPWNLADNQNIPAGSSHDYIITVNVNIDLVDQPTAGDEIYHHCGSTIPGTPSAGEGLFNESQLDVNNDGIPDQRDSVCADVEIIDLALRKTVVTAGPYKYGDNITFRIVAYNQGNTPAHNLTISDYVPSGYSFSPLNVGWTMVSPTEYRSPVVPGPLAPRDSAIFFVVLKLQMTSGGASNWINYAEINDFTDAGGTSISNKDIDSRPHSDGPGERAVTPGASPDNNITSKDKGGEEDDHDPAGIEVYDLALRKTTPNPTGPWKYGDVVPFTITVFNQGNVEARDVQVVDYLPTGLDFGAGNPSWSYDVGTRMALTTIASIPAGGQTSVVINLVVQPSLTGMAEKRWYNEAEIKTARDNNNTTRTEDIDSRFDMNPDNDNDVVCDGPDDDEINEDGKNVPGDDEDDNDIEWIHVFDLALKKTEVSAGPYRYGQDVRFRLTVYNQGNITAQTIKLTDYLPAGFVLSTTNPNGWTMNGSNAEYTITTPLAGGATTTVDIYLTVVMTEGGRKDWLNYAEITGSTDSNGDNSMKDADSMPGSDNPTERSVTEGSPADNNVTSNDKGGEEDDHDPDGIDVYDLALIKIPGISGPYTYGQVVPFTIKVLNQGNIGAKNIQLIDYIPNGFEWVSSNEPDWTYFSGSKTATYTYPFLINPGDTAEVTINLRIVPSLPGGYDRWVNYAEIRGSTDENNNPKTPMDDMDSMTDTDKNNDPGGVPDSPDDDYVEGDKYQGEDEDDHDPARLEIIDLALRKVLENPGAHQYYDYLDFGVWIFNQGNTAVEDVEITDYKPAGYAFNGLLPQNAGWSVAGSNLKYTLSSKLKPGDSIRVPLRLQIIQTTGGEKDWINYSEITEVFDTTGTDRTLDDIDSNPGSDNVTERGVEPGDIEDDNITSIDKGGEEDDHDPAGIEIFDLAQRKYVDESGPFQYGDELTFRVTVFNQGSIEAKDIVIVDYIPDGFTLSANNPGWTSIGGNMVTKTIAGPLKPGDSTFIQINLDMRYSENKFAWDNYSEIKSAKDYTGANRTDDFDSNEDMINGNDVGGNPNTPTDNHVADDGKDGNNDGITDEDDHDVARVPVWDLALIKKVNTAGPYQYGQTIRFDVIAYNQGNYVMDQVTLVDYLPQGYGFTAGGLNTGWSQAGSMLTYVHNGIMEKGDSVIVPLYLKILQTNGGRTHWTNRAEIKTATDTAGVTNVLDADGSTPNMNPDDDKQPNCGDVDDDNKYGNAKNGEDEDDHDPACIEVFDLALRKRFVGSYPIHYNDVIPFEITLFNQGNVDATNVVVVDYVPTGYEWVANAGWTYNNATRMATYTYPGPLQPGNNATISINLKVVPDYTGITAWDNLAEIKSAVAEDGTPRDHDFDGNFDMIPDDDMGGKPNTPTDDHIADDGKDGDGDGIKDHDDHDPARPQILNLALRKWVMNKKPYYLPGDTVPFTITVFNQGNVPVTNVTVNDYMPQGYVFTTGVGYNTGWTNNAGTLNYTHVPTIKPNDSVQLTLKLKIQIAASPTIFDWDNYAEIKSVRDTFNVNRDNDDADSKPNTDSPWERQVKEGHPWDNVIDGQGQPENEDEDDHDFENVKVTGALGDKVWKDLDGDGIQDPGEPGVPNVIVTLYECGTTNVVKKDTTDANGNYFFDFLLPLKSYFAVFKNPDPNNCGFTFQDRGNDDRLDSDVNAGGVGPCTYIEPGERDSTYDAGLVAYASYGDLVWHDRDGDGRQDAGEEGIADVTVTLYDGNTNLPVRVGNTNSNGIYLFDKLYPGSYYAKYEYHPMWTVTTPNVGNDTGDSDVDGSNGPNTNATTYLSPDEDDLTWDLGLYKCIMFSGDVWHDLDLDGIYDPAEKGINGLYVYLVDAMSGATVGQTLTSVKPGTPSDDGYYKFCVRPGMYFLRFERPGHLAASDPFKGNDKAKDSDVTHENGLNTTKKFTVLSGDMVSNIGAGFQTKSLVGDKVWIDRNFNGIQENGEAPLQGVTVAAYKQDGTMVSESTTGYDGQFTLDGISQGDYFVKFTLPNQSFGFTLADAGADEDMDSDVNNTYGYGTTKLYRILAGEVRPNIDAGVVGQALAVEWLAFDGEHRGDHNLLNWSTKVDLNNDHFIVERRLENELDFVAIGRVEANTNYSLPQHDYNFNDYDLRVPGVYYYRLIQYDHNGGYTYSKIISLRVSMGDEWKAFIYPNPAKDNLNLELYSPQEGEFEFKVFDHSGKAVLLLPFSGYHAKGKWDEHMDISMLASGQYVLQITGPSGVIIRKFTVSN